jgi:hypothetical protein
LEYAPRVDVEELCDLLIDWVEENRYQMDQVVPSDGGGSTDSSERMYHGRMIKLEMLCLDMCGRELFQDEGELIPTGKLMSLTSP